MTASRNAETVFAQTLNGTTFAGEVAGDGEPLVLINAAVRERVRSMDLIVPAAEAADLGQEQPLAPPAAGRLAEIRVPTLIMVGDQDQPRVLENAALLEQGIAGARKIVLPSVAHLPNMKRPAEFNHLVLEWLAGR